jgi:hypothetical protein
MIKSISIFIAVALIAVTSQSAQAQDPRSSSTLVAGNSDETVEISVLFEEGAQAGTPCSLSFEIQAFDATLFGAPVQTESVMLGPNESKSVQFQFELVLSNPSKTHSLLLSVHDYSKTGGCRVRSYGRIVGPAGETRATVPNLDATFLLRVAHFE